MTTLFERVLPCRSYTHVQVYILPADHINVYFQRALPDNERWRKIKTGHVFDLADPLMTVIDSAVHVVRDQLSLALGRLAN